jgi:hypothetical protein
MIKSQNKINNKSINTLLNELEPAILKEEAAHVLYGCIPAYD